MKTNKFNIGQTVIVIDDREIKEKTVLEINGTGDEISYELGDPPREAKPHNNGHMTFRDHVSEHMSKVVFSRQGCNGHVEMMPPPIRPAGIFYTDFASSPTDSYDESEIFATEDEFRKSVKITKYPVEKPKTDLLRDFKDAVSKLTVDDSHKLEGLVKEFQSK